jgi:putative glutamine amidotransferase
VVVTGPRKTWKFGWWATKFQLWRVGLRGVYVCPGRANFPARLHGVIIGGGDDIDPTHYGASGLAEANYDAARDSLELQVIQLADEWSLPILGICRGSQLINVSRKGSLIGDLRPLRRKTTNRYSLFPIKFANIKPDSQLATILNTSRLKVNSLHHQAIDQVGEGLSAVAHDDDQFVQAIEGNSKRFLIGVQWHPEYLPFRLPQTRLFNALKKAAYDYAKD